MWCLSCGVCHVSHGGLQCVVDHVLCGDCWVCSCCQCWLLVVGVLCGVCWLLVGFVLLLLVVLLLAIVVVGGRVVCANVVDVVARWQCRIR